MTRSIEIQLSDEDMKRLNVVAAHQGNAPEIVAWLGIRLYLTRFNDLMDDNKEKEGENNE